MSRPAPTDRRATRGDEPLLSVRDLRTVFYTDKETIHAVDGISFDIYPGETVGLVGESGSGKSVTARSILGLVDEPGAIENGEIRFKNTELVEEGWDDRRGEIAIIFQDPSNALNPVYTIGNQIREALNIHQGLSGAAARERAIELLEAVGIPDAPRRVDEYPHQFSGGMAQRAVIAISLACDPDLLVCDEPTTALDVTIQAQILDLLNDLQAEEDLAILFITHDMGVIEETADRVTLSTPVRSSRVRQRSACSRSRSTRTRPRCWRVSPAGPHQTSNYPPSKERYRHRTGRPRPAGSPHGVRWLSTSAGRRFPTPSRSTAGPSTRRRVSSPARSTIPEVRTCEFTHTGGCRHRSRERGHVTRDP